MPPNFTKRFASFLILLSGGALLAAGPAPTLDCATTNPECPELVIEGDAAYTYPNGTPANFSGFADPSLRQDPRTKTLWLAYSRPNLHIVSASQILPAVSVHLARSDDGGQTWRFDRALWEYYLDTDRAGTGEPGISNLEAANLLPVQRGSELVWVAARLNYFVPSNGSVQRRMLRNFRIEVIQAKTPPALANAETAALGTARTARGWGPLTDLTALSPEVEHCWMWNEPALAFEDEKLYLALRCVTYLLSGDVNMGVSDLYLFRTTPQGNVSTWRWEYAGQITTAAAAAELGGESLTQVDFARGQDGRLLLLVRPRRLGRGHQRLRPHGAGGD